MKFQNITVGGTFDLLHAGHKALLNKAFEVGEVVWLGVTSDFFCQQKKSNFQFSISNYQLRKKEMEIYLKAQGWMERARIISIEDKFGTTLKDEKLQAIVVSPETKSVAVEINKLRQAKNWPDLEIIEVPWVLALDNQPINSKRIRSGEIDRQGKLFNLPEDWGVRHLPENLRLQFKKPLGDLLSDLSSLSYLNKKIIAIGDATVVNFLKHQIIPDISIIDFKIQRQTVYKKIEELGFRNIKVLKKVINPSGTISYDAFKILSSLVHHEAKPSVLHVEGEDDLLTLLAAFLAPLGWLIVYGQPNQGLVVIKITEEVKSKMREYLNSFSQDL